MAEGRGYGDIGFDVRDALDYILQCSSNTSFQGVFVRAVEAGLLTHAAHKHFEKRAGSQHLRPARRHLRLPRHRQLVARCGRRPSGWCTRPSSC